MRSKFAELILTKRTRYLYEAGKVEGVDYIVCYD